ncbi:MAG: hypothetical protein ACRDQG_05305 [Pseudonocardiaceae bacterium]
MLGSVFLTGFNDFAEMTGEALFGPQLPRRGKDSTTHRRRPGRRRGSAHDRTSRPYAQVVDDDVLVIETSSGHALAQGRPYANRYANR